MVLTAADFDGFKFKNTAYRLKTEWDDPQMESSEWSGNITISTDFEDESSFYDFSISMTNEFTTMLTSYLNPISQYGDKVKMYDNNGASTTKLLTAIMSKTPEELYSFKTPNSTIFTTEQGETDIPALDHGVLHVILMDSYGSSVKLYINNIEAIKYDDNNFIHEFASTETSGLVNVRISNSTWSTTFKIRTNIDNKKNNGNCKLLDASVLGKTVVL